MNLEQVSQGFGWGEGRQGDGKRKGKRWAERRERKGEKKKKKISKEERGRERLTTEKFWGERLKTKEVSERKKQRGWLRKSGQRKLQGKIRKAPDFCIAFIGASRGSPFSSKSPLYLRDEAEDKDVAEPIAADRESFSTCQRWGWCCNCYRCSSWRCCRSICC